MPYETFDKVAALDTASQRELVQRGTPLERIWAAWALGLHLGRAVAPDLLHGLQSSPDPGTRRHLIVVLAGLGERAALVALAEHDPDEFVRATACQYLGNVALPKDPAAVAFLRERLAEDRSTEVRAAILRLARDQRLPLALAETTPHLQHAELAVRRLAVEILRATNPSERLYPGPLETHLAEEADADLRVQLIEECIACGGADRLLQLALRSNDDLRRELLHALRRTQQRFAWAQLAPLAGLNQPMLDTVSLDLLRPGEAGKAFDWLLFCAARPANWPASQSREEGRVRTVVWDCAAESRKLLLLALSGAVLPLPTSQQRTHIEVIIRELQRWESFAEPSGEEDEDEDVWYPTEATQERLRLLDALRLLYREST